MKALSQKGAEYFCGGFAASVLPNVDGMGALVANKKVITEGTPVYGFYRDTLLREADRWFFMAVSCFRRSHDLMLSSGAFWAHTTLYYSSFLAARSVLALLGCWFESVNLLVEVAQDKPGSQSFVVRKSYQAPSGSHKGFWTAYYNAMTRQVSWIDPALAVAVSPINNNAAWQIDTRNKLNYRGSDAVRLIEDFTRHFDATRFPLCLRGETATQYKVTQATVLLAAAFAKKFGLATDVFASLGSSRSDAIDRLVYGQVVPNLGGFASPTELTV